MYIGNLPAVSNRETFEQPFEIIDDETGTGFDLTDATIVFEIRDPNSGTRLSATNGSGVSMTDAADGIFVVTFSVDSMRGLCAKEYDVGCTIDITDVVSQIFIGRQPVLDGVVS